MENKKRVLLIDDDARNIFALSAVLKSKGYSYSSATSAAEGIKLLSAGEEFGIILMDMMMPEMDGYAAIQVIRNNPAMAAVPIVAVTAQAMQGDREKCLEAGANEYISKPIDQGILMNYLKRYLG